MTDAGQIYDLMQELTLLDPKRVRLFRDEFEALYLQEGDSVPVGPLTVQRAFPVSNAEELEWTYFAATITAVHSIERGYFPRWDVDTDRGRRVFELRSSRADIRVLSNGRVFLRDADGNR